MDLENKIYYFGYGSNLDDLYMTKRCSGQLVKKVGVGLLEDFKLTFHYWANVEKMENSSVFGVVYELSLTALGILDSTEEVPLTYTRSLLPIKMTDGSMVNAYVYELTAQAIATLDHQGKYPKYMQKIISNAVQLGFSKNYINYLHSLI